MSEVITVRVKKSLKEKIRKHKINVSKTIREALEDEVKKRENAELSQAISQMKAVLEKIPDDEIVRAIRIKRPAMKHYLLDASAFMILIKKANVQDTIECLQDSSVLDLTYYEVGNAIWKESILTKFLTPDDTNTLQKVAPGHPNED